MIYLLPFGAVRVQGRWHAQLLLPEDAASVVHEVVVGLETHNDRAILVDLLHHGCGIRIAIEASNVSVVGRPVALLELLGVASDVAGPLRVVRCARRWQQAYIFRPLGREEPVTTLAALVVL